MTSEFRPDVVGGKYDARLFDPTGATLLVNEIFYSLQGEGKHTGQATVFIRLAKCNLACKFCDTEFETFQPMTVEDIVARVLGLIPEPVEGVTKPWVDLTGGEPLLQNCGPLVSALARRGLETCVETSGSVWAPWVTMLEWVTVSPKVPLDRIPVPLMEEASEFKWIVNAAFLSMLEKDPTRLIVPDRKNYLQPESNLPKFIAAATKLILRDPRYTLSLQTHKLAGNP